MTPQQLQKGFTLIEVLVASLVLFAAIAASTQVFRTALTGQQRAYSHYEAQAWLPFIRSEINYRLQYKQEREGEGQLGWLNYTWTAEQVKQRPLQIRLTIDEELPSVDDTAQLTLYRIALTFTTQGNHQTEASLSWKQVIWSRQ